MTPDELPPLCPACGRFHAFSACTRALADRIAKLEARLDFSVKQGAWSLAADNVGPPAAAGPIPPGCVKCTGGIDRQGRACRYCSWKVEPPAEQPASADDEVPVTQASPETITAVHAMTAKWPPAPAQGAPAEPLSDFADLPLSQRIREAAEAYHEGLRIVGWDAMADGVAALEAKLSGELPLAMFCVHCWKDLGDGDPGHWESCEKHPARIRLAAAERERDEAVAAERERCLYHVETYEPRRDVPDDWTYQGALSRVADAIRDGKPAPK